MKYNLDHLNSEQKNAVIDIDNPIRIIAGPGSGKTMTIVSKYLHLIINESYDFTKIYLVTFTNKATQEIINRVSDELDKINYEYDQSNLKIFTIHSFCKRILDENISILKKEIGATNILSGISQASFILSFIEDYGWFSKAGSCKEVTSSIIPFFNKITDEGINSNDLFSLLSDKMNDLFNGRYNREETEKKMKKFKNLFSYVLLYDIYEEKLLEKKYTDFSHIQKYLWDELNNNEILLDKVKSEIDYILVDEYQDTSQMQSKIISKILNSKKTITICGDDDQSLYRFRGATVNNFLSFENVLGTTIYDHYLKLNYRSAYPIVDKSKVLINNNLFRIKKDLKSSDNSQKGFVSYFECDTIFDESKSISDIIISLKDDGIIKSYSEVAILFRSVIGSSGEILSHLSKNDIPYTVFGIDLIKNSYISKSLIAILSYISGYGDLKINDIIKNEYLNYFFVNCEDSDDYLLKIDAIKEEVKGFDSNISIYYELLLNSSKFLELIKNDKNNELKELGILSQIVSDFDSSYQRTDPFLLSSLLHTMIIKGNYSIDDDIDNHIKIMTVHQSKGLEFPIVFYPHQIKKPLRKSRINDIEIFNELFNYETTDSALLNIIDERKVFYVAMTRAQSALIYSRHLNVKWGKGTQKRKQNDFLEELGISSVSLESIKNSFKTNYNNNIPTKIKENNLLVSFSKLRTYIECPRKYNFLYKLEFETVLKGQMTFGLSIHNSLDTLHKNYLSKGKDDYTEKELYDIIDNNWIEISYKKRETKKLKDTALIYLFNYHNTNKETYNNILESEKKFRVINNGHTITGVFDLITKDSDKINIVDFKVNDIELNIYKFQMLLYGYCYYSTTSIIPKTLSLYSIKTGKIKNIKFSADDIKIFPNYLEKVISKIKEKDFSPNYGDHCDYCSFKKFCYN
ncbi:MAG: ATP-dependent helicase [Candidatus Marinimicrobia bacterium]|nr:ATP-dependent helicase [Candidatus Neomarinimicrobiota bacterium]